MSTAPEQPTIAIVGRPNVGKSTLFNRLTATRDALVSDLPGLTRDRKEGEVTIYDSPALLVDTAGLEDAAKGSISARMRAQTELAVRQADLVLFLIDARAGVTPVDEDFARFVRHTGCKVVLVANKCEGRASDAGYYDAFEMGFGEPVAISAEHGEGLGDLEVAIATALGIPAPPAREKKRKHREREEPAPEGPALVEGAEVFEDTAPDAAIPLEARTIRIAVLGRPNAGKSTLVNALLGEERMITGPEPGLTRDAVSCDFEWKGRKIRITDTAGLRKKAKVHEKAEKLSTSDSVRALRHSDLVVLVVDAAQPFERQDLTIAEMATEEGRAIVLAVNKWDTIENKQQKLKELNELLENSLSQVAGVTMIPLSALSERGLDKLMNAVVQAYDLWNRRIPTAQLNRWLMEATGQHAPPAASGRRIKLRYMTQTSARPPTFVTFCSKPEDVPKSYIRYLVNSLRSSFKLPGVPIRLHLRKSDNPYA